MQVLEQTNRRGHNRRPESGYSLLMVVFLVATSLILSAVVVPNLLTQGRREREEEMVWRGEQYQRAIGLYYRKFGKYPTKIDDLTKQTNGVRFLRQAYTDPMNKEDGTWRFIYVGPNGQLIGSVKSQSLLQSALTSSSPSLPGAFSLGLGGQSAQPGAPSSPTSGASSIVGALGGPSGQAGSQLAQSTNSPTGQDSGQQTGQAFGQQAGQQNGLQLGQTAAGGQTTDSFQSSQPQPLSGTVIGGNIIGVGSKMKNSSIMVYLGGDTYNQWEFIWNPMQQGLLPDQQLPGGGLPPPPGSAAGATGQLPVPQNQQPQQQLPGLPPPSNNPPGSQPLPGM